MTDHKTYTVQDFADLLGVSPEYVRQMCRGQTIGSLQQVAKLPPGCFATKRKGSRAWQIRVSNPAQFETSAKADAETGSLGILSGLLGIENTSRAIETLNQRFANLLAGIDEATLRKLLADAWTAKSRSDIKDVDWLLNQIKICLTLASLEEVSINLRFRTDGDWDIKLTGNRPALSAIPFISRSRQVGLLASYFLYWQARLAQKIGRGPFGSTYYAALIDLKAQTDGSKELEPIKNARRCAWCGRKLRGDKASFCPALNCGNTCRKTLARLVNEPVDTIFARLRKQLEEVESNLKHPR